jgi:hypothetical protein
VDEDAHPPRSGVCDRRLHTCNEDIRRADLWVLRGWQVDLCRENLNGFTSVTRAQLFKKFKGSRSVSARLQTYPRLKRSMGQGLTKAKTAECQWLKPVLVGQFEFLKSTGDNHLRHSKFVGLREDRKASDVVREWPSLSSAPRSKSATIIRRVVSDADTGRHRPRGRRH